MSDKYLPKIKSLNEKVWQIQPVVKYLQYWFGNYDYQICTLWLTHPTSCLQLNSQNRRLRLSR